MEEHKIRLLLALQEIMWKGEEKYILSYGGEEKESNKETPFNVDKTLRQIIIKFFKINERLS